MTHLQWDIDTLAAEKRLFSIKNVVINLDSATIKWNGQFTNYHGKNRQGLKADYIFFIQCGQHDPTQTENF